eukprot:476221-Pelagomonas_calceolata.AAC.1
MVRETPSLACTAGAACSSFLSYFLDLLPCECQQVREQLMVHEQTAFTYASWATPGLTSCA